jgi:transcriptional regulator of heat shock response
MAKSKDYEARRRSVLAATINKYIHEALPVASEDMASVFEVSSATIRNIFSELEDAGLLMHPYTSGGRVPTEKGYRYYVDLLLSEMQLLDEEKERILSEYRRQLNRLDETLEKTSEVIAAITHYTGIVSFLEWQDKFFYKGISMVLDQPEFRDVDKMRLLVRLIEDKKKLLEVINRDFKEKVKVYIGRETGVPQLDNCALVVTSYRVKNRPSGRVAVLGPVRMEYRHIIPTLEYVSEVLSEALERI